jgi:tagaturonate reductase
MPTRPRLSRALLPSLSRDKALTIPVPSVLDLPERAVQFGTGALLRGLIEPFLDDANARGAFNGRVVLIEATGSGRGARLNAQDGLYTLMSQGLVDGRPYRDVRVIGAVSRALVATDEWSGVLRCAEIETIECVFSNTTEVGIVLDEDDAAEAPEVPRSFPGRLTRFLQHRALHFAYDAARAPVIVPCELIDGNGTRLREIVRTLAARWALDARFAGWLDSVVFCDTLVDRIVPGAPTPARYEELAATLGYDDAMMTICEPYRLLVIQGDDALRARLGFVGDGVLVTADIAPYRERKVRLLNGAHTALVSLALLAGCRTVREAVSDPALGAFLDDVLFGEIIPSVDVPGAELFAREVLDRFANPDVEHALWDITLQGTAKLRVRLVPTIVAYAARTGHAPRALTLAFAGYLALQRGDVLEKRRAAGDVVPADDDAATVRAQWCTVGGDDDSVERFVRMICSDRALWHADLTAIPQFVELVTEMLARLRREGVYAALSSYLLADIIGGRDGVGDMPAGGRRAPPLRLAT